jgi:hypothetical protein
MAVGSAQGEAMTRPRLPAAALLCCLCAALAAADQADPEAPARDRVRKVGPHLYVVGTVVVDAEERTVRFPGRVNMDAGGPIELLLCLPRGKTHESVFTADIEPMDLQLALLLLGMQQGRNPAVPYRPEDPEGQRRPGDRADIFVEWRPEGADAEEAEPVRRRAERFLLNLEEDAPEQEAGWVFLGSTMLGERFGADVDGSLITTYHDPLAVLELELPTVNDDVYYAVNEDVCPAVGTSVELIVQAPPREEEGKEDLETKSKEDE